MHNRANPEGATLNILMYFVAYVFIYLCISIHILGPVLGIELEPSFNLSQ